MNNSAAKVGEIFREAGTAFNKLSEMTLMLQPMDDSPPGGKWSDAEVEMLRGCINRFAIELNKISQHIKNRTMRHLKCLLKMDRGTIQDISSSPPQPLQLSMQQPQLFTQQPQLSPQQPQLSPQHPQFSPQQPQLWPQQLQLSPQQPQLSPQHPQFSPQQPQLWPQQLQLSPQQLQLSPQQLQLSPQQLQLSPQQLQLSPQQLQLSPQQLQLSPQQLQLSPQQLQLSPQQLQLSPQQLQLSPQQLQLSPQQLQLSPQQPQLLPQQPQLLPQQPQLLPQQPQLLPQQPQPLPQLPHLAQQINTLETESQFDFNEASVNIYSQGFPVNDNEDEDFDSFFFLHFNPSEVNPTLPANIMQEDRIRQRPAFEFEDLQDSSYDKTLQAVPSLISLLDADVNNATPYSGNINPTESCMANIGTLHAELPIHGCNLNYDYTSLVSREAHFSLRQAQDTWKHVSSTATNLTTPIETEERPSGNFMIYTPLSCLQQPYSSVQSPDESAFTESQYRPQQDIVSSLLAGNEETIKYIQNEGNPHGNNLCPGTFSSYSLNNDPFGTVQPRNDEQEGSSTNKSSFLFGNSLCSRNPEPVTSLQAQTNFSSIRADTNEQALASSAHRTGGCKGRRRPRCHREGPFMRALADPNISLPDESTAEPSGGRMTRSRRRQACHCDEIEDPVPKKHIQKKATTKTTPSPRTRAQKATTKTTPGPRTKAQKATTKTTPGPRTKAQKATTKTTLGSITRAQKATTKTTLGPRTRAQKATTKTTPGPRTRAQKKKTVANINTSFV